MSSLSRRTGRHHKPGPKVLLITQYFEPDITAAAFRLTALYRFLKKRGCDVHVLTAYPHKTSLARDVDTKEDNVTRVHLKQSEGGKGGQLKQQIIFMLKTIGKVLSGRVGYRYDYVIATSPPLFVGVAGYVAHLVTRAKFLLDVRDIWPDSACAAGMLPDHGPLYRLSKSLERFLYRAADHITCVSQPMAEYISGELARERRGDKAKVSVVYNGVDLEVSPGLEAEPPTRGRTRLQVVYTGNMGHVQGLDVVLDATKLLLKDAPDVAERVSFIFLGEGARRKILEGQVEQRGLKGHVFFTGPMSKSDTLRFISEEADGLFIHLERHPTLAKTIPSKLFDYLMCNKPILYGIEGEGKAILDRLGAGIGFTPGSARDLMEGVKKFVEGYDRLSATSAQNGEYVASNFEREACFAPFEHLIKS